MGTQFKMYTEASCLQASFSRDIESNEVKVVVRLKRATNVLRN